jgi:hypothetical protein
MEEYGKSLGKDTGNIDIFLVNYTEDQKKRLVSLTIDYFMDQLVIHPFGDSREVVNHEKTTQKNQD